MEPRIARVKVDGVDHELEFEVHATADRYISDEIVKLGTWEPLETEVLRRLLVRDSLFLDAGANLGWYSVIAASWGARVIAVEPFSANLRLLRSNLDRNQVGSNVTVVAAALGASTGSVHLELSADNQGDHRMSASPIGKLERVDRTTVDDLCREMVPGVVKLDTQGSEVHILRGGTRTFDPQVAGSTSFITEYWPYGLAYCGSSAEELIGLLAAYVPRTHACFEFCTKQGTLREITLDALALMARSGDLSPAMRGHTNLVLVPHSRVPAVADLIDSGETEPTTAPTVRTWRDRSRQWAVERWSAARTIRVRTRCRGTGKVGPPEKGGGPHDES